MANFNVAGFGDTIEVLLVDFSWLALAINGEGVPGFKVPGSKGKRFVFTGPAPFEIMASSKRNITIASPSQNFVLKGPDKSGISYVLSLDYFPQSEGFNIVGMIDILNEKKPEGEASPINFSQDTMTGQLVVGKSAQ